MFFKAAVIVIVVSALSSPKAAEAATRHAAPDGDAPPQQCLEADPCSLANALGLAQSGDRILIAGGRYRLPYAIDLADRRLEIAARSASNRPQIISSVAGGESAIALGDGSVLRDVDIAQEGAGGFALTARGVIERVRIDLGADFARGMRLASAVTVRDSAVFGDARHIEQVALFAGSGATGAITARLRNVTAVVDGEGVAVEGHAGNGNRLELDVRASVLRGAISDAFVVSIDGTPATLQVTDSHVRGAGDAMARGAAARYVDGGGVTAAEPLFADRGAGDLRPAAGSPTIDAGSTDGDSGRRDLAGHPRTQGLAADAGAYERTVPPTVRFTANPIVTPESVTVAARIALGGWTTTLWRLELYREGRLVADTPPAVSIFTFERTSTFAGLQPDTPYRARAVATGPFGSSTAELDVRTAPAPGAGPAEQAGPGGTALAPDGAAPEATPAPAPAPAADPAATPAARGAAPRDTTAPAVRVAWRRRALRVTVSEPARIMVRTRTRAGRTLRTRTLRVPRGTTLIRAPRLTAKVRSVRVVAVDAAGNTTARVFRRPRGSATRPRH